MASAGGKNISPPATRGRLAHGELEEINPPPPPPPAAAGGDDFETSARAAHTLGSLKMEVACIAQTRSQPLTFQAGYVHRNSIDILPDGATFMVKRSGTYRLEFIGYTDSATLPAGQIRVSNSQFDEAISDYLASPLPLGATGLINYVVITPLHARTPTQIYIEAATPVTIHAGARLMICRLTN